MILNWDAVRATEKLDGGIVGFFDKIDMTKKRVERQGSLVVNDEQKKLVEAHSMSLLDKMRKVKSELSGEKHALVERDEIFRYSYLLGITLVASVDREMSEKEIVFFEKLLNGLQLAPKYAEKIKVMVEVADEEIIMAVLDKISDNVAKKLFINDCIAMAKVDGAIRLEEQEMIDLFEEMLHLGKEVTPINVTPEIEDNKIKAELVPDLICNSVDRVNDDECYRINGTSYEILLPQIKEAEKFFYSYRTKALDAERQFQQKFLKINNTRGFAIEPIMNLFNNCFDETFNIFHDFILTNSNYDTYRKEEAKKSFDIVGLKQIAQGFEKTRIDVEKYINEYTLEMKRNKGSSATMVSGSIGFMATVGVLRGIGKAFDGISSSLDESKFRSQVNEKAIIYMRGQYKDIERILINGIIKLFNDLSQHINCRTFEEIQEDERNARALYENFASIKSANPHEYISKMIKALYLNRTYSTAYWEIMDSINKENFQGKIEVLEIGITNVISEQDRFNTEILILRQKQETAKALTTIDQIMENISGEMISQYRDVFSGLLKVANICTGDIPPNYYNKIDRSSIDYETEFSTALKLFPINNIITYYSINSSKTILTYAGIYIWGNSLNKQAEEAIMITYLDLESIQRIGSKLILSTNNVQCSKYDITIHWEENASSALVNIISKMIDIWKGFISEKQKYPLVSLASKISAERLDSIIDKVVGRNHTKIYKLSYEKPDIYYSKLWALIATDKYPTKMELDELSIIQNKLEISDKKAIQIRHSLAIELYDAKVREVAISSESFDNIVEVLVACRKELGIDSLTAYISESKYYDYPVTTDGRTFAFMEFANVEYKKFDGKPFGKSFWSREEDIPGSKLNSALSNYLQFKNQEEILLFYFDNTFLGGGEDGFAITDQFIYSDNFKPIKLSEIISISKEDYDLVLETKEGVSKTCVSCLSNEEKFLLFFRTLLFRFKYRPVQRPSFVVEDDGESKYATPNNNDLVPEDILTDNNEKALTDLLRKYQKKIKESGPTNCAVLDDINKNKIESFTDKFNDKLQKYIDWKLKKTEILAYSDGTILGKGDDGIAVIDKGICVLMPFMQRFCSYDQMIKEPQFDPGFFITNVVMYTPEKIEAQLLGSKSENKIFFELIKEMYLWHQNKEK